MRRTCIPRIFTWSMNTAFLPIPERFSLKIITNLRVLFFNSLCSLQLPCIPHFFLPLSNSELLASGRAKNRGMVIWEFEVKFLNCSHGFMGCYPKTYYLYVFPWCWIWQKKKNAVNRWACVFIFITGWFLSGQSRHAVSTGWQELLLFFHVEISA